MRPCEGKFAAAAFRGCKRKDDLETTERESDHGDPKTLSHCRAVIEPKNPPKVGLDPTQMFVPGIPVG